MMIRDIEGEVGYFVWYNKWYIFFEKKLYLKIREWFL